MPISLPPLSRRSFLQGTLATGAGLLLTGAAESPKSDPHRFALLSDAHVPRSADIAAHGTNMTENLRRVVAEVSALEVQPAATLISGDCAYLHGLAEDYAHLLKLVQPLREAGQPLHLVLGNHDHRERIQQALPREDARQNKQKPLPDRRVAIIESPRANWFLLDSLMTTNRTPGRLGEGQLKWLAGELDRRDDRPALIVLHHNPDTRENTSGLTDTKALMDVVAPRRHVQAVLFGHTHAWSHIVRNDGLHLVNLPPTAYVFVKGMPNGWVDAHLSDRGMTLELRCIDPEHVQHGETKTLNWRA